MAEHAGAMNELGLPSLRVRGRGLPGTLGRRCLQERKSLPPSHYVRIVRLPALIMLRTMSHDVHRKLEEEGCGSAAMRARGLSGRSGLCNDEVFYDEPDRDVAIDTLRRRREIGIDFPR